MSLENEGTSGAGEQTDIAVHIPGGEGPLSVRDAQRSLTDWRRKQNAAETTEPDASADTATPEQESAAEADAAPPQEATGETQDADPVVEEQPPIPRPRSWSKERDAVWAKLDRETQEYLVEHDSEVSKGVRNAQNEAAEQRKGLEAERAKVEQARQQYESALPILMQNLQSAMAGEFSDIQTMADVQRMANDDFPRYVRWDAQQKQLAAVQQEITSAQQRQVQEKQQKLSDFMKKESELFADRVPEIADETKRTQLQTAAVSVLKDLGFKDDELGALWRGEREISIHDHRLQLLIRDGIRWRDAEKKGKACPVDANASPIVASEPA